MKPKQIILILVIIVVLAIAGVFAYKATTSKAAAPASANTNSNSAKNPQITSGEILPHGNKLDFSTVKKFNPSGKTYPYPTATPDQIGGTLNDIVSQ